MGSINPSLIISSVSTVDPVFRAFLETIGIFIPLVPSGSSGDVTINTPDLTVGDGAQITVRNDGSGDAGLLTANADRIKLQGSAGITASTQQGEGGNLFFTVSDGLLLRSGSQLLPIAGSAGDGGNITLRAPVIAALENSDIIANAVQGAGGNIQISTQGLLGISFRNQLTLESDITASSQFGVSGQVEITNLEVDPSSGVAALPENVTDSSDQIVVGCSATQGSQFVASGRGGLPLDPSISFLGGSHPWVDIRDLSAAMRLDVDSSDRTARNQAIVPSVIAPPLIEATALGRNLEGKVALVAAATNKVATPDLNCHLR